jgi:hypothetical protein
VPTNITDVVTLVAILLGSITAGLMLMRPLRRATRSQPTEEASPPAATDDRPDRPQPWSTEDPERPW